MRNWPVTNFNNLYEIYLNLILRNDQSQILNLLLVKFILFRMRNNLYLARVFNTLYTVLWCSFKVQVKIRMSSRYTIIMHSAMKLWKMLFIIVWKIARLLVILENITKGSKRLQLV